MLKAYQVVVSHKRAISTAVVVATLAILLGACDSGGARLAGPTPSYSPGIFDPRYEQPLHVAEHGVAVGTPRPSFIENLPIPEGFRLVEERREGYYLDAWYQAPEGVTIDDLVAWFQRYVPPYRAWNAWNWCPAIRHNTDPHWGGGIWGWEQDRNGIRTLHARLTDSEDRVRIHLNRGSTGMCGNG